MSSLVTVAPREVRDLVERCCRLAGCDPGTAAMAAERVTAAQIDSGDGVERFMTACDDGELVTSPWAAARPLERSPSPDRVLAVHRAGLCLDRSLFARLEERARGFLVAEALLDRLPTGHS